MKCRTPWRQAVVMAAAFAFVPLVLQAQAQAQAPAVAVEITAVEPTGQEVGAAMFGANMIFVQNTDFGQPTPNYTGAVEAMALRHIRFPAGQGDGAEGIEGTDWLDITRLVENDDGPALRPELLAALDWARDPDGDGDISDAVRLSLVIPTRHVGLAEYATRMENLARFAELLMRDHADSIARIEIGNEYWGAMGETEYGLKASLAANALAEGMERAGFDAEEQPEILVQMGATYNQSEFTGALDSRGYFPRLDAANETIIAQLDRRARSVIDGVIEHYYWRGATGPFTGDPAESNFIGRQYQSWETAFDHELTLNITEWNTHMFDYAQNGAAQGSVLLEQLRLMVGMGVDSAYAWPLQHNTANDLAGSFTDLPLVDPRGAVINSVGGAVFDLAAEALPGAELLTLSLEPRASGVALAAYRGAEGETILYVASRRAGEMTLELDLGPLASARIAGTSVSVDTAPDSSDGVYYSWQDGQVQANAVRIGDQPYFYDEHDARALVSRFEANGTALSLNLRPYEVVQLILR